MSKRHNWFSSSRKQRLNSNANKTRETRRRTLARTIQLEKFEERIVMDSSIGTYPYWVNTRRHKLRLSMGRQQLQQVRFGTSQRHGVFYYDSCFH